MQSPVLAVVNQCIENIVKLSREFGLTPAARSRVSTTSEPEVDLLELALSPPLRE
jgi:phage terminase small subunit